MEYYKVELPIIRRNYNETNAAKFKGILTLYTNEFGIVYNWKINFSELYIDLYTTKSHVLKKTPGYLRRKELFGRLNLEQEIRPSQSSNKLVKVNDKDLEIVNEYFNNRKLYKSTIKNIVGTLKGNNPGGEYKKPDSAEMIVDSCTVTNFTILIDDLIVLSNHECDTYELLAKTISIDEFINITEKVKDFFEWMQCAKESDTFRFYREALKKYVKEYKIDINDVEAVAKKERAKYGLNVDLYHKQFPFGFTSKTEFQKCHIYDVWRIKDDMLVAKRNGKDWLEVAKEISDPENFIPLVEAAHRQFDRQNFTYTDDGIIAPINAAGREFLEKYLDDKFRHIDSNFITEGVKKYLEKRNKSIGVIGAI